MSCLRVQLHTEILFVKATATAGNTHPILLDASLWQAEQLKRRCLRCD